MKLAFYEVVRRRNEAELAADNQKLLEDIRRRIAVRVDVGEAPRLELTRADAEARSAANATASAGLRVTEARAQLFALTGLTAAAGRDVEGALDAPPTLPPLDTLRDEVLERYPLLAQSRAEIRRAEARLRPSARCARRSPPSAPASTRTPTSARSCSACRSPSRCGTSARARSARRSRNCSRPPPPPKSAASNC